MRWRQAARSPKTIYAFSHPTSSNTTLTTTSLSMSSSHPDGDDSAYAPRPAPASFEDFMAQVDAATRSHGGIMVDESLYEELFAAAPHG